jgi:hypothetical protein
MVVHSDDFLPSECIISTHKNTSHFYQVRSATLGCQRIQTLQGLRRNELSRTALHPKYVTGEVTSFH